MTTFKKRQVVMLPTNEKAGPISIGNKSGIAEYHFFQDIEKKGIYLNHTFQHLYFLSDEEIKDGDWYYDFHNQEVCQSNFTHLPLEFGNCKKIIATTDKSLMYLESDYSCNLPQPSQSFIEYFVEEYNKGNVITEVKVEYEKWIGKNYVGEFSTDQDFNYKLKINPDNTINIKPKKDSWSREEVMEIARRYAKRCQAPMTDTKWFEENI